MSEEQTTPLSSLLSPECTRNAVHCSSKKRALEIISELAADKSGMLPQVIFDAILTRERMGNTCISNGVAVPHGKLNEDVSEAVAVFLHLEEPIKFSDTDNQPVDLLFSLLVPENQCDIYSPVLSKIAKKLEDKVFCRRLRNAQSDAELYHIITE